jgi:hypothetical protein
VRNSKKKMAALAHELQAVAREIDAAADTIFEGKPDWVGADADRTRSEFDSDVKARLNSAAAGLLSMRYQAF